MKSLQGTIQTLTRGIDMWQSHVVMTPDSMRLTVNVQIELSEPILQEFIELWIKFVN